MFLKKSKSFLVLLLCAAAAVFAQASQAPVLHNGGGAYFWLEPGTFELELFKREWGKQKDRFDLDRTLRADLLGPAREPLASITLKDEGFIRSNREEWGPAASRKITVQIKTPGVYLLLVSVKRNSYFQSVRWGFNTNAKRYLIDAGGGHRDTTRVEAISFIAPRKQASITFAPAQTPFSLSVAGLKDGRGPLNLVATPAADSAPAGNAHTGGRRTSAGSTGAGSTSATGDARGNRAADGTATIARLEVNGGAAQGVITTQADAPTLTLQLPYASGQIQIEGRTSRAGASEPWMPLWTPEPSAWFDLEAVRWLLYPRYQQIPAQAGQVVRAAITLSNTTAAPLNVQADARLDDGTALRSETLTLAPAEQRVFAVEFTAPAASGAGSITVNAARAAGSATATVADTATDTAQAGAATAKNLPPDVSRFEWGAVQAEADNGVVTTPFRLSALRHYPQAFGIHADKAPEKQVYFDSHGSPWFLARDGLWTWRQQGWQCVVAADSKTIGVPVTNRIGADSQGNVYAIFQNRGVYTLVAVDSQNLKVTTLRIPGRIRGKIILQAAASANLPDSPPVLLVYERAATGPRDPSIRWGVDHTLTAYTFQWKQGELTLHGSHVLSTHCIGISDHSGLTNPGWQKDGKAFIVYGETSAPDSGDPGVPTFVQIIDLNSGEVGKPMLMGYAPPVNDGHNTPSLLMDSKGGLHVILGAHNHSFNYTTSHIDNPQNWSALSKVAEDYDQTYVGAVIDPQDTIHLVSRIWRRGKHFPADEFDDALIYQKKEPGSGWSKPQLLLLPPMPHYSGYYHRLTIAPDGTLYLAWTHWPTWSAYRNELSNLGPASYAFDYLHWRSRDGGKTWEWVRDWNPQK